MNFCDNYQASGMYPSYALPQNFLSTQIFHHRSSVNSIVFHSTYSLWEWNRRFWVGRLKTNHPIFQNSLEVSIFLQQTNSSVKYYLPFIMTTSPLTNFSTLGKEGDRKIGNNQLCDNCHSHSAVASGTTFVMTFSCKDPPPPLHFSRTRLYWFIGGQARPLLASLGTHIYFGG